MKTNKQKANDIGEVVGHLIINGSKVGLILFGGLSVFLFIAIYCAMIGQFALGFAINSILLLALCLVARKIKKKKENF